ncbi:hypothetical protein F01_480242 [Burkholderia cenocepacia]|nr:hypothetical protein F01_480242 [Burkholderia cenocepacia]
MRRRCDVFNAGLLDERADREERVDLVVVDDHRVDVAGRHEPARVALAEDRRVAVRALRVEVLRGRHLDLAGRGLRIVQRELRGDRRRLRIDERRGTALEQRGRIVRGQRRHRGAVVATAGYRIEGVVGEDAGQVRVRHVGVEARPRRRQLVPLAAGCHDAACRGAGRADVPALQGVRGNRFRRRQHRDADFGIGDRCEQIDRIDVRVADTNHDRHQYAVQPADDHDAFRLARCNDQRRALSRDRIPCPAGRIAHEHIVRRSVRVLAQRPRRPGRLTRVVAALRDRTRTVRVQRLIPVDDVGFPADRPGRALTVTADGRQMDAYLVVVARHFPEVRLRVGEADERIEIEGARRYDAERDARKQRDTGERNRRPRNPAAHHAIADEQHRRVGAVDRHRIRAVARRAAVEHERATVLLGRREISRMMECTADRQARARVVDLPRRGRHRRFDELQLVGELRRVELHLHVFAAAGAARVRRRVIERVGTQLRHDGRRRVGAARPAGATRALRHGDRPRIVAAAATGDERQRQYRPRQDRLPPFRNANHQPLLFRYDKSRPAGLHGPPVGIAPPHEGAAHDDARKAAAMPVRQMRHMPRRQTSALPQRRHAARRRRNDRNGK